MKIKELLANAYRSSTLLPGEIDSILGITLHKTKEYVYKKSDKNLTFATIKKFKKLIKKREADWPMAYLRGWQEFYGLKFLVNKNTLIPRPDSELIIDTSLDFLKKKKKLNILDIGTGSACLIIALAKNSLNNNYFASDISKSALKIAKTNARKNKVKINFIHSNLLKNISKQKFDLIVANLPYLKHEQMEEPSIKKEPRSALLSGKQGLDHYTKLLSNIAEYLNKKFLILLEIDPQQNTAIKNLIKKYLPKANIEIIQDLNKLDRLVKISSK
jgi:release factor glutamine methyltransferase